MEETSTRYWEPGCHGIRGGRTEELAGKWERERKRVVCGGRDVGTPGASQTTCAEGTEGVRKRRRRPRTHLLTPDSRPSYVSTTTATHPRPTPRKRTSGGPRDRDERTRRGNASVGTLGQRKTVASGSSEPVPTICDVGRSHRRWLYTCGIWVQNSRGSTPWGWHSTRS